MSSVEMVGLYQQALQDAVAAGQVGPAAGSDHVLALVSVIAAGTISQYLANEPGVAWAQPLPDPDPACG